MEISFVFSGEDALRDARLHFHARDMYCAVWDIDQMCRNRMKYEENVSDEEFAFLEKIREEAREVLHKVDDL